MSNIDIDSQNIVRFTASIGDKIKICAPAHHLPISTKPDNVEADQFSNGFVLYYPNIGSFESGAGARCVYYRHKRSGAQIIKYISVGLGTTEFYAIVDGIIVHDHASVYQGGPAYATYYAEVEEE